MPPCAPLGLNALSLNLFACSRNVLMVSDMAGSRMRRDSSPATIRSNASGGMPATMFLIFLSLAPVDAAEAILDAISDSRMACGSLRSPF